MEKEKSTEIYVTIRSKNHASWQGEARQGTKTLSFESELEFLKALEKFQKQTAEKI